jgi:spore coat polysaccharide biosynthesis protein SpsF (cytidylyltransferase family)
MKIVAVIQARMGSTRLPGKVLMDLSGRPVVEQIRLRLALTPGVDEVALATTTDPLNDALAAWAQANGIVCVRHPEEDDIAGRLAAVLHRTDADAILKINGDCPILDRAMLAEMLAVFRRLENVDYLSNKVRFTWPLGFSAEVIARAPLMWCNETLTDTLDREYVCDYLRDNLHLFSVVSLEADRDLSRLNLMIDTPRDYEEMSDLFIKIGGEDPAFGLPEVLSALGEDPTPPRMTARRVES